MVLFCQGTFSAGHTMSGTNQHNNEAFRLARSTAGRYGPLALSRAAGEAAAARRNGDGENSALWSSVVATLRAAILQGEPLTA